MKYTKITVFLAAMILVVSTRTNAEEDNGYGVDVSFPIHHNFIGQNLHISDTLRIFGPRKLELYNEYINGCKEKYAPLGKSHECTHNENERIRLNSNQPGQMTNHTEVGFKKIRVPDELWNVLQEFWAETMDEAGGDIKNLEEEHWPEANTYTNHWSSVSRTKDVYKLAKPIWEEVEKKVQEWVPSASSFSRSSLYGVRVYTEGSILATHVDRDPLITSAIINIAQDVDEPWPLEVYGHDGRAHNITMEPGDMVLYESHSVLHGRPFPLKGRYFANIFVHFKPWFEGEEAESIIPKEDPNEEGGYGVDASFPIHHNFIGEDVHVSDTLRIFGPRKLELYNKFLQGCQDRYAQVNKAHECVMNEQERIRLNLNQPSAMTNYTDIGFKKIRLSDEIWTTLNEYWNDHMTNGGGIESLEEEHWPEANTYVNHWSSESRMKHLQNAMREPIWQEVESRVKEWVPSASSFSRSSLYGIRVYTEGSILATHVDRDPLITSAIINVGQDVDEPWPLEVYGHDGRAHNITMEPGDMVLYESHSVLHGRPFPLNGRYFANIFAHFKPLFEQDLSEGEL